MKKAFTLSEVLITLGIIGVIAAFLLPAVITNYEKSKTEKRVAKFYSLINQALSFAIADYGEPQDWLELENYDYNQVVQFLNKYFLPYLKYEKYKPCADYVTDSPFFNRGACVTLVDGTIFQTIINKGSVGIWFFSDGNNKRRTTHNTFGFELASTNSGFNNYKYSIEPHLHLWDGKEESLVTDSTRGCNNNSRCLAYCTQILKANNWKINNKYPW